MQWKIFAFLFNVAVVAAIAWLIRHQLGQRRMAAGPAPLGEIDAKGLHKALLTTLKDDSLQFCERLRGWDLQHKPLRLNERGLINCALVGQERVYYGRFDGRRWQREFDLPLAGVDRLQLHPVPDDSQAPDAVFVEVYAGEVLHYLLARKDFAQRLAEAATAAKQREFVEPQV